MARSKKPVGRSSRSSRKPGIVTGRSGLVHHRHSFQLVHYRHTHYALVTFMLMLTAIFSVGWTTFARGDSYVVHAVVAAAPLTSAATITTPTDGAQFIGDIVTVQGQCPDRSYVKLYRNGDFAGAAICRADGSWSVQANLVVGTNRFEVQDYNVTDQAGPKGDAVSVTYVPPTTTTATPAKQAEAASTAPLLVGSVLTYKGYFTNQLSEWPLTINGGKGPYSVQIDWGDGQTDIKQLADAGSFDLQHTYTQAGGYKNSYVIMITARDSTGQTSLLELFTIVAHSVQSTATTAGTGGSSINGSGGGSTDSGQTNSVSPYQRFWNVAGPTYVVATIAVFSFWLGGHGGMTALAGSGSRLPIRRVRH